MAINFISHQLMYGVADCEWNDWIIGDCSKTCGGGTRTDTRTPKKSAEHGGQECDGPTSVTESCNVQECPGRELLIPWMPFTYAGAYL